ncbi:MAG: hypothetical protein NTZ10_05060 [Candidatus Saganbacteria bacterium]|nr:hypothetical protein [Candidatus Saganbacteria bacterium]
MRKMLLLVTFALFLSGCQTVNTPKIGNLEIDGAISAGVKSYGAPYLSGYIKNTGNNTVYNSQVAFTVYSDSTKKTIKDTGRGFPASLGDILPDIRAPFEAVFFALSSTESVAIYDYKITWLEE